MATATKWSNIAIAVQSALAAAERMEMARLRQRIVGSA